MGSSNKTLAVHISDYLNFYVKEQLSFNTFKNYKSYLAYFEKWFKKQNLVFLTPQEFTQQHLAQYCKKIETHGLSLSTQTRYLIALRGLFSYLMEQRVSTIILPQDIKLPKLPKRVTNHESIDSAMAERLRNIPDSSTTTGLRDSILLSVLLASGLKVSQIAALNREDIVWRPLGLELAIKRINPLPHSHYISLPKELSDNLENYFKRRTDSSNALFVRTSGPKNASPRLTTESIERIVKRYTNRLGFTAQTPETLRGLHIQHILENEKTLINYGLLHQVLKQTKYKLVLPFTKNVTAEGELFWNQGEQALISEIDWLRQSILVMPTAYRKERTATAHCDNCMLRKVALLIVSGKIAVTHIEALKNRKDFWDGLTESHHVPRLSRHGEEWHRKMMDVVTEYFKECKQMNEPTLHRGRADLGIVQKDGTTIYIEVGTVSLFKLWYNLWTMKDCVFLLVPSENYVIEFKT